MAKENKESMETTASTLEFTEPSNDSLVWGKKTVVLLTVLDMLQSSLQNGTSTEHSLNLSLIVKNLCN